MMLPRPSDHGEMQISSMFKHTLLLIFFSWKYKCVYEHAPHICLRNIYSMFLVFNGWIRPQIWKLCLFKILIYGMLLQQSLNAQLVNKWMGTGQPTSWPPHSPYLSPFDFLFLGYIKSKVYSSKVMLV